MYSLFLLDGVALNGPAGPVSGSAVQRRHLAILALLGAAGDRGLSRDRLLGLLWPESDEASARHLLRDSLYHLRRELGQDAIQTVGDALRLNPAVVWCDVCAFRSALERDALEEAVGHYRGKFLHGFHLRDVAEYERWADTERQRLADRYEQTLESLARAAEEAGDHPQAVTWWRRLVTHDPYNSRFILSLMGAMAAAGDPANARQLAADHQALLREELGEEAASEFRLVARQIELKGFSSDVERMAAGEIATPAAAHPTSAADPAGVETPVPGPALAGEVREELREPAPSVAPPAAAEAEAEMPGPGAGRKAPGRVIAGAAVLIVAAVATRAGLTLTAGQPPVLDDSVVAIIPFEAIPDNEQIRALQRAAPILLEPMIESSGRYRAVPYVRVTDAVRAAGLDGPAEPGAADLQSLGMHLGARYVLSGTATGDDQTRVVTVRLFDVARDEQVTVIRASMGERGVVGLIDDLYIGLAVHLAGESVRAERFFGSDPQAVDLYVAGIEAGRRGDFATAERSFASAMESDTTFALAAAQILDRGVWAGVRGDEFGTWARRAEEIGRNNLHRLPAPERAIMSAFLFIGANSIPDVLENWRRAAEAAPDNGVAIGRYGDYMLHDGGWAGFPDHLSIAMAMFDSLAALGVDWNEVRRHADELRLLRGDTAFARAYLGEHRAATDDFDPVAWLAAHVVGDAAAQQGLREAIPSQPFLSGLLPVMHYGFMSGLGLADADAAARAANDLLEKPFQQDRAAQILGELAEYSLHRGRPNLALEYFDRLAELEGAAAHEPWQDHPGLMLAKALWTPAEWALGEFVDPAESAAEQTEYSEDEPGYVDRQWHRARLHCRLGLYLLDQSADLNGAELQYRRSLEVYEALSDYAERSGDSIPTHPCGELLGAALATGRGDREALSALLRFEQKLPEADAVDMYSEMAGYNITLARAFARLGEYERALAALERRRVLVGPYPFWATRWLLRSRYLRELRRYGESAEAYSRYLGLLSDPEPHLEAHVASVRRELADLVAR